MYEGGVRVPFIVSWPGTLKPGVFGEPVSSLDVFPTALAAANGNASNASNLDGVNLLPHLKQESKASLHDRPLFWRTNGGANFAIRKGEYKLIKIGKQREELYDLSKDIGETNNLASERPDIVSALQKELDAWNAALMAPLWEPLEEPRKK